MVSQKQCTHVQHMLQRTSAAIKLSRAETRFVWYINFAFDPISLQQKCYTTLCKDVLVFVEH